MAGEPLLPFNVGSYEEDPHGIFSSSFTLCQLSARGSGIFISLQERLGSGFWASLSTVASRGAPHPWYQLKSVFCLLLLTEVHQNLLAVQLDLPQGVRASAVSQ